MQAAGFLPHDGLDTLIHLLAADGSAGRQADHSRWDLLLHTGKTVLLLDKRTNPPGPRKKSASRSCS